MTRNGESTAEGPMAPAVGRVPWSSERPRDRLRGRVAGAVIALVIGLVLATAMGEVVGRTYLTLVPAAVGPSLEGEVGEYDPLLGYRLRPGSSARFVGLEFDTRIDINAHGLRMSRHVPYARQPGRRRVLLLGDSFTFGHGVEAEQRFGDRLEAMLPDVEIVNMGVWGTGTDQQLLLYRQEGVRYAPDLVVLAYMTENIQRNASAARLQRDGTMTPKPRFVLRDGELELTNVPVPRVAADAEQERRAVGERWDNLSGIPLPFKDWLRDHSVFYALARGQLSDGLHALLRTDARPYPEYDDAREEWQLTKAIITRLAVESREHGSSFLLVVIPTSPYVYKSYLDETPHAMLDRLAATDGVPVLDLLPALRDAASRHVPPLYFKHDPHWTAEGHAVAARAIAERLRGHPWE